MLVMVTNHFLHPTIFILETRDLLDTTCKKMLGNFLHYQAPCVKKWKLNKVMQNNQSMLFSKIIAVLQENKLKSVLYAVVQAIDGAYIGYLREFELKEKSPGSVQ